MRRKIIKVGNSEGITIPKAVREYLNIKKGDFVEIPEIKKIEEEEKKEEVEEDDKNREDIFKNSLR